MGVLHFYQVVPLPNKLRKKLYVKDLLTNDVTVTSEICYNLEVKDIEPNKDQLEKLFWLMTRSNDISGLCHESSNKKSGEFHFSIEIGPRLNFCTPLSTNAICILKSFGLDIINRFEISHVFHFASDKDINLLSKKIALTQVLHDKMTEMSYLSPISSFDLNIAPSSVFFIDVIGQGRKALEDINKSMGLAMDEWDLSYYYDVFVNLMHRNPTNVECFDLAQSNSEHSRHWFFKGQMIVDSVKMDNSLFDLLSDTLNHSNRNNVIAFSDNSSAIKGFNTRSLALTDPTRASVYQIIENNQNICFTAETHNFPTGVAPFPGAATGTGGRIRDVQAVGTGGYVVAGTAGYCFGNLRLPDYPLAWEHEPDFQYPHNFAQASEIAVEASNGASDYGNEFGEPVISGFCRSFGMKTHAGEWREWIKPIMFSGGMGQVSSLHIKKTHPATNHLVLKIGGPVYRIGVGGGAASSVEVQGDCNRDSELDIGAVQRGDAQMENKLNRVIRGCIDLGPSNPIKAIHDQGAGGNGNVLKELVDPLGAIIDASKFTLGDPTINLLELWGAEYQESNGLLIDENDLQHFTKICDRERCPINVVGKVTGDGNIRLKSSDSVDKNSPQYPVDMDLKVVLGKMPQKKFYLNRVNKPLSPLQLPLGLQVEEALARVLRLPSVGSKRFLTNKVDRSVTGLIAQQQCVGPLHTPLADLAVVALSYWDTVGSATSIGEQPIKMLLDSAKGAKLCVAEAISNLCMAVVTNLEDVKVSGNWMWPAKLPGEGAALWDACNAFCKMLTDLNIAIDGGKDSLSMAATVNNTTVVKSPGSLVVSAYVGCPDIRLTVTPDLKGNGTLLWIRTGNDCRLGGSALAQCFAQLGDNCPDLEDVPLFKRSWKCLQNIFANKLASAAHDISDGGLIGCILEMSFAGNVGCEIDVKMTPDNVSSNTIPNEIQVLFNEEVGWVIEVPNRFVDEVVGKFNTNKLLFTVIGQSHDRYSRHPMFSLVVNRKTIFNKYHLGELRTMWEDTSYHLEKLQCNPECVENEYGYYKDPIITKCPYIFDNSLLDPYVRISTSIIRVAIVREEGSNGDKEMAAVFMRAGFEVWDVVMQDFLSESLSLDGFKGLVFVGGFSYGDVLGSAKGWAASIMYNENVRGKFDHFKNRQDTFSLGVCNGCQLLSWLGWLTDKIDGPNIEMKRDIILEHNESYRFESRFSYVTIPKNTKSVMFSQLKGARLGVWVSHGEGRFIFNNEELLNRAINNGQTALEYVSVNTTHQGPLNYPFNPNGSTNNIAGMCSKDGRHLAIMPHPERSSLWWQWPYTGDLSISSDVTPWMSMFTSALKWCENQL